MTNNVASFLSRYGCAFASVALATWVRLLLDPALGNQYPFATVFIAVLLTAWYGGFLPALAAVILGAFSANYFFMPPRGRLALEGSEQQVGMFLYAATSLAIAALGGFMHATQKKAEASAETARRQAALIDQNADLVRGMQQLGEVNRELRAKTQEAEAFVYSVSHDLRSPLVNLQGFSEELGRSTEALRALLLENGTPASIRERGLAQLDGPVTKSLRFIQTAVSRLSNIIDALVRLSRAGRVIYQRQRVDMQVVIARIVESLKITMEERGATIRIDHLPPALGDPTALEQVFANLIGNALNYLDGRRHGHIEIGCTAPDSIVLDKRTYYVRDNGMGIPEVSKNKVFQPFQRLHPQAATGEGMGLAVVQRVVERHGGKIWFESRVGQGTCFFVALPVCPEQLLAGVSS